MKRALYNQPDATPCGSTDNRKRNKTANLLHPFKNGAGKLLLTLFLMLASVGAWAADYVIAYVNGGTTYYLARNGTTGVTRTNTFNPTTCIWSCETSAGAEGTLNNSNTYGYLYQTVNGTKYYLYADVNAFSLKTDRATNNYSRMRTNGTYVYNRYSNTYSYYINLANNAPARNTTASTASNARPYQVTTNSVAVNNNGITAPTISCSGLSGSAGIQLSRTGVGGSYIPAHTTYAFNNQTIYYYNNTAYTNTNQFAVSVNANDATYNWSVTAGTANVSTTGVVTLGNNNTQNVTVRCRATINGVNKDATYTLNATRTDALNETAYGDISITPSSQTLDLGEEVTYTVSPSISQVTKTRPQYVSVTDAQGHTHYKVGTTYQATEPAITETPGTTLNFTSFNWSAAEGGAYFTLDPYYSASSNQVTLTRSAQKTGTQQTFTISVTGVYGGQNKTASATVTIPATQVDLTALHAGAAINLGVGSSESINGHYTYEPDYDAAGSPYLKFKYISNSESVATVDASGKVTAVGPGSTTITITAVKLDGTDGVSCNVTVNVAIDPPTINIDGSGNVTITHPADGVTIRYTTNGTDPTATTGTVYNGAFGPVANETTVKAVAVANSRASAVSSGFYATSGISGTKVILNDYEDHNWTYYQPNGGVDASYAYPDQLCSPYPRNVKITYLGNGLMFTDADGGTTVATTGVQVSRYETENTFVYYKTLERDANDRFPYELIPNPFSKRPVRTQDGTTKWRGFYGWRIKSVTGGTIYDNGGTQRSVGYIFTTEYDKISFQPTDNAKTNANNATSMEVEFEAVWARAYRVTCNSNAVSTAIENTALTDNSYERNFVVVNTGTGGAAISNNNQKPVTIMMVEPDGSDDYRTTTRYIATTTTDIIARNTLKIEWCNIRARYISANGKDMVLGRGITYNSGSGSYGTPGTTNSASYVSGIGDVANTTGTNYTADVTHKTRIESGVYGDLNYTSRTGQGLRGYISSTVYQYAILGNDYERANKNGKTLSGVRLLIKNHVSQGVGGTAATFNNNNHANASRKTFDLVIKSGYVGTDYDANIDNGAWDANYEQVVYIGVSTSTRTPGYRTLTLEGGNIAGIAGGVDRWGTSSETGRDYNATRPSAIIRLKGSEDYPVVRGPIYAGAANAPTYGIRSVIATGGLVKGWVAGGCNGNDNQQGRNFGPSYVYIGGNTQVNSNNANTTFGAGKSIGGMVYAAGSGQSSNSYSGRIVWGTHLAIADECYIERNAFGGGNYGYSDDSTYVYISGGHVKGKVFGGASLRGGKTVDIVMSGGQIDGGLYGGSNENGTISENVKMYIFGGQIGTPSVPANIHGGGYGDQTVVSGNVEMTLGNLADEKGAKIYGNVYGGSALGTTGGDTKHTYVTVNRGNITGNVFGGGMGEAGSNTKGVVTGAIKVDVYGTDPKPSDDTYALYGVYGGGDLAPYAGTPIVTVHNCDNSIEYVYGGGNATSVAGTDVTIWGGNKIGNVFGGGNGQVRAANISGSTNVKIYGGTIENVFPGSNTNGTIGGNLNLTIEKHAGTDGCEGDGMCPFDLGNVYSGGNKAASKIGNVTIGCLGNGDKITNLFGGAKQANVTGNVNLLITGNHIENVFGGNDISGQPSGTITVVVDWDPTCTGAYLGNVYGGGRDASYEAPNGNKDYPQVFVRNAVVEHDVFGGGLGESALVTGNPQVTVSTQCTTPGHTNDHMVHIKGSLYGGGSAAPVTGNPVVNTRGLAGDAKKVQIDNYVFGGGFGQTAVVTGNTEVNIKGNTVVNKNVYGGGNGGLVTGNTNIVIGD